MLGLGRGVMFPFSSRLYCINTKFQISNQRSQSHSPIAQTSASHFLSSPLSIRISLQGPQGPVSPIDQKLSFSPNRNILSLGTGVNSCHKLKASSSSL